MSKNVLDRYTKLSAALYYSDGLRAELPTEAFIREELSKQLLPALLQHCETTSLSMLGDPYKKVKLDLYVFTPEQLRSFIEELGSK